MSETQEIWFDRSEFPCPYCEQPLTHWHEVTYVDGEYAGEVTWFTCERCEASFNEADITGA